MYVCNVQAMLFCVSCDLPALREVTQFLSHKANKGCNICEFEAERETRRDGSMTGRTSYFTGNASFNYRNKTRVSTQAEECRKAKSAKQVSL